VRSKRIRKLILIVAVVGGVAVAGVAYAYFTSKGQGTGSAATGTAPPFTVSSTADVAADLVPNTTIGTGTKDTIAYTVTNSSTGNERLTSVVISVGGSTGSSPNATETNWTATSGANPACNSASFSVGGQAVGDGATAGSGAYTVSPATTLAPSGVYNGTFTLQMIDNGANQNSCAGVTVPMFISAS
jgi:hypothetical protein